MVVPPRAAAVVALSKVSAFIRPEAESCSMCAWLSTPPGSTNLPRALISRRPGRRSAADRRYRLADNSDIGLHDVGGRRDGSAADHDVERLHLFLHRVRASPPAQALLAVSGRTILLLAVKPMKRPRARIHVVNPNSNEMVTRALADALDPLRFADGPEIVCSTLKEGPPGIETQADVESVTMPLRRLVETDNSSHAFVVACYSDPGLHACREGTARPVFGIAECAVLTALSRADRFGVIAIRQRSIARHVRYLRQMGLSDRFAGERPLGDVGR